MSLPRVEFDDFERDVLVVTRELFATFATPALQSWGKAFSIAEDIWGETAGLVVAQKLQKLVRATLESRRYDFDFHDPFSSSAHGGMTRDETNFLQMLHYMRRDNISEARKAAEAVSLGKMDPYVLRASLAFADRFMCPKQEEAPIERGAHLRLVQ
ncbi:MAG: hypothetical protein AAGA38_12320 [Pseudomonadota bacterium]